MRCRTLITAGLLALLGACSPPVAMPDVERAGAPVLDQAPAPAPDPDAADPQSTGYYGSGHNDPPPDSTGTPRGDGTG